MASSNSTLSSSLSSSDELPQQSQSSDVDVSLNLESEVAEKCT